MNNEEGSVNLKRARSDTDKGALFHDYDLLTLQFIAHIRRIHPENKTIEMDVVGKGKTAAKAANPLAEPGVHIYYIHGTTKMYFFFSGTTSSAQHLIYFAYGLPLIAREL